ncbi:hypothetical protein [Nevskia ramosa]|uniref:hypothetical protein n=1 Tax=Nevskia ramosa TaxID=64002 RepID=UPI003D0B23DB
MNPRVVLQARDQRQQIQGAVVQRAGMPAIGACVRLGLDDGSHREISHFKALRTRHGDDFRARFCSLSHFIHAPVVQPVHDNTPKGYTP